MSAGSIFIVDDNPNNLNLLDRILTDRGYVVRAATSGRWALTSVRAAQPELIMLDVMMPEMDGYEVCRELKSDPRTAHIPVLFISALDDVLDKVRAFKAGAVDYVTKPFQVEEILARVECQLQLGRLRGALERSKSELERQNDELRRTNDELVRSRRQTERVFAALSDALPGTVIDDRYRLERKIGAGGFGAVFRATHVGLDRPVAIKVFRPASGNHSAEGFERFRLEGISACRVNHPNAVQVLDSGISSNGIAYLVMELLEGRTLRHELQSGVVFTPERAGRVMVPVCGALAAAHAANIIHRDIKPDNIFLHRGRDGETVKVVDFGIAKLLEERPDMGSISLTGDNQTIGTPVYMSPERLLGEFYDGRADVYSIGVMLYESLSGHLPFPIESANPNVLGMICLTKAPIPLRTYAPGLSEELETLVMRAMAKDPASRPTAAELAVGLSEAVGTQVPSGVLLGPAQLAAAVADYLIPPTQPVASSYDATIVFDREMDTLPDTGPDE
jgi:serine/threonine protein kinase/DNA-binding response OmpR family regulator